MTAVKVTYLKETEYIYDDNGDLIATRHTDTGVIIVEPDSPFTEEEIRSTLQSD